MRDALPIPYGEVLSEWRGQADDEAFTATERSLIVRKVMVVEDDDFTVNVIRDVLRDSSANIVGVVSTLAAATLVLLTQHLDAVVLDLNVKGELAFEFADELVRRNIPMVFVTGYNPFIIPERFADVPLSPKPISAKQLIEMLAIAVGRTR